MKILILAEFFPYTANLDFRGGVEARTYFSAVQLAKEHQVTVIAAQEGNMHQETIPGIEVIRCGPARSFTQSGGLLKRYVFMRNVIATAMKLDVDIVEGTNFILYQAAISIAKKKRIPAVATYHDVWIGEWRSNLGLLPSLFGEFVERRFVKYPWAKVIAVSTSTRAKLLRHGVEPKRITVIPNGVDFTHLPEELDRYEVPTICYVGRLVSYKRVHDLLEVTATLRNDMPDLQVKIVGSGPQQDMLEAEAERLGISDRVHFLGFVEKHVDVLEVMAKSHIVCLPSSVEGFGIVLAEAMALGTPYVSSELPPTLEVTENGVGGILYPPGNLRALEDGIRAILSNEEYAAQLGSAGRELAKNRYDWEEIGQRLRQLYQDIK